MIALVSAQPYVLLLALGALLLLCGVVIARHHASAGEVIRRAIGLVLVADAVAYVIGELRAGSFSSARSLPLAICNALVLVAAVACFTDNPLATELTWFLGLAGSLEGLLTPDLSTPFPHLVFFEYLLGHLGVVAAALLLVVGLGASRGRGAVWHVFAITLGYAVLVGIVDWRSDANYLFLRRPPSNWTVLRLLGPWPLYVLFAALLCLALFFLLDAPFVAARNRREPRPSTRSPLVIWLSVVGVGVVVVPAMALLRRRAARWRLLVRSGRLLRRVAAVPIEIVGTLPAAPVVICPNHTSFLDGLVVVLAAGAAKPLTFLVSGAIGRQRLAGGFLRLIGANFVGMSATSPRQLLNGLASELAAGRSVVIFPEGSVAIGPLRRFHLGAFALALQAAVPVVPLAIGGSATVLPPGSKRPRPGAISAVIGHPIAPFGDGRRSTRLLSDEVHRALARLLDDTVPRAATVSHDGHDSHGSTAAVSSPGSPNSC